MKNSIKQLLRRPVFLISFVLLLTLSCAFLCLSAGLWASARQSIREAEGAFTTIAVLNDAEFRPMTSNEQAPKYAPELLERVKESGAASRYTLMADARQSLTGYSEDLYGVMISDRKNTGNMAWPSFTTPYAPSVLVVECIEVAKNTKGDLGLDVGASYTATFRIDHGASPAIHPGYSDIHTLKMESTYYFSLNNPIFQEGKTYMLYTADMEIRSKRIGWFTEVEAGDGTAYSMFGSSINAMFEVDVCGLYGYDWLDDSYYDTFEYDVETDSIHGVWKGVDSINAGYSAIEIVHDDALPTMPFIELTDGMGVEDVLNSQYGEMWERIIRQCSVSHHSFQIFRTNSLDSMLPFNQRRVSFTAGRGFTRDEYMSGERVCAVSSEFAKANGLEVGDTVTAELFNAGYQYVELYIGDEFYPGRYKYSMELSTPHEFRIVGIYSSPGWEKDYYSFTPNTVFVPFNSIEGEYPGPTPTWEGDNIEPERPGMFSLKLKNGSVKEFEAEMEALGYGGMYYYFDQGYSRVEGTLNGMNRNAALLMGICGLVWVAATALFMVLYIGRTKKELGIMASLGAGRRRMFIHTVTALAMTALISAALGGFLGYTVYNAASDVAYEYAREQGESNLMFSDLPAQSNLTEALWGEPGRDEDISAVNLSDTFDMKKSPESVWYAAAGQFTAIIGASAIAAAVLSRKKPVELTN